MKKIIFFVREIENDNKLFLSAAKNIDVELDIVPYDQITFEYKNNNTFVLINNKQINTYDLVHFRNVGTHLETQILLSEYFINKSVPIFDPVFNYNSPWIDRKSFEYLKFSQQNLPIIDSYFISKTEFEKNGFQISFPCIAKITSGKWGEGVFLCKTNTELINLFDKYQKKIIIQPFIENDGDLRVFVIGNKVIGTIKRIANKNEYRNNVALGGKSETYEPDNNLKQIAIQATKALNYSIAGVDLIFDKNSNEWKIIEVNRGPKFEGFMKTTGINIPKIIISYLKSKI